MQRKNNSTGNAQSDMAHISQHAIASEVASNHSRLTSNIADANITSSLSNASAADLKRMFMNILCVDVPWKFIMCMSHLLISHLVYYLSNMWKVYFMCNSSHS